MNNAWRRAAEFFRAYRRKKKWRAVVTVLASVVVFCTTYALILPAITLEQTQTGPVCSAETLGVHKHTDGCYDENGALVCGYADFVVHMHEENCYDADGNLLCSLDQIPAHTHTAECYVDTAGELICDLEESAGYTHTDVCYDEEGNLICETEESDGHVHTDECYDHEQTLLCEQEQILLHQHDETCFDENGNWVCGKLEISEHVHNTSCFASDEDAGGAPPDDSLQRVVINNPSDNGPVSLPVDYYVYLDGEWICVGATKNGWYGDYTATGWTDTNRDYITVEQAASVLGEYGFNSDAENPARLVAYQMKSGNTAIYSDTNTVEIEGRRVIPLSRNADHPGFNVYYLPNNSVILDAVSSPDALDTENNAFYTVSVYDAQGNWCYDEVVRVNGSFTYNALDNETTRDVTDWLVTYGDGHTETINDSSTITIGSVTGTTTISPLQSEDGMMVNHRVTFKVCVDGQWQEVGSLPYYYSGSFDGQTRAYITSSMAAQILGDGYTAGADPGYQFGYSYDDIYNILWHKDTGYAMDVHGANFNDGTDIWLYTFDGSLAQTFRIWEAEAGYHYITPVTNSNLHVNVYGGGSDNDAPIALSGATNDPSRWRLQWESDNRVSFWTKTAPDSACIDLDSGKTENGTKIHIWNGTENRYWRLNQVYRISNNTVSEQNSGDTYKIGLTQETNGDIVCYYLPGETADNYDNVAESAIDKNGNRFWSITVRDDNNDVYSDVDLRGLRQIVRENDNSDRTIAVLNGPGVIWSCVGMDSRPVVVTTSESGGYTYFNIENIDQPIEIVATKVNPTFTVQYYANIDRYVLGGGSGDLDVINTSGGNLPVNTVPPNLLGLTLEDTGTKTDQNGGIQTNLHRVKSEKQLTKMYADGTYDFERYPGLEYFDKLWGQANYKLDAVLVLKDGKSPDSTNDDDWWWYYINQDTWSNITFTNFASEEKAPRQEGVKQGRDGNYRILLQEGTVLRLRYETGDQRYTNQASFHDYDITSGENSDHTWRSGITGINRPDNYGMEFGVGSNVNGIYAFGNSNCETGLGLAQWDGNNINAYNGVKDVALEGGATGDFGNNVYKGCTFGMVEKLNDNGDLVWANGITAPRLFNEGDANGKHSYNGGSLEFIQTGDTYTLTAANSTVGSRDNLEYFFHPSPSSGTTYTHIYTNNFWPMDFAQNKTDPLMGQWGHPANTVNGVCDIQVNGFWDAKDQVGGGHNGVNLPLSDDGNAHNWFFGMNFSLSFTLTEDYLGPLEYLFFGDDDMWVFLDNQLICDIGGVHSSVGEYVNLWDHLEKGDSGRHTLSFFYTERGASGSTCWMSFTLPSVTSAVTGRDIGSLQITKQIGGVDSQAFSNEEFRFEVQLLESENGPAVSRVYSCAIKNADGGTEGYGSVQNGSATITLKPGWTATIEGIPAGTYYRVTETTTAGYSVTANNTSGYIVSGTIEDGGTKSADFVNTPLHELPQTGGVGRHRYTMGGVLMIAGAGALVLYNRKKRRREAV